MIFLLNLLHLEYAFVQWCLHILRFVGVYIGVTIQMQSGVGNPLCVSPLLVATSEEEQ